MTTVAEHNKVLRSTFDKAIEKQRFLSSCLIVSCTICQISIVFPDESDKLCSHLRKYFSADRNPT